MPRKVYNCEICDNRPFRDKTTYTRHCETETHKLRESGMSKDEADKKIRENRATKISEANKIHATNHVNPRKGVKLNDEERHKHRQTAQKRLHGENIEYIYVTHPEIAKEWHPTLNGNKSPTQFTKGSDKKIFWLCPNKCEKGCLHEYEQTIYNRTSGHGCPFCSTPKKKICIHDSIVTTHPEFIKEWHHAKNSHMTPDTISHGSKKPIWWLCQIGCPHGCLHEYKCDPNNRFGVNQQGCPFCCNQKICFHSSIEYTHPHIAKEWHPTKNGDKMPSQFSKGTERPKFWWICSENHEYEASIKNRTLNNSGCPNCKHKTEQKLTEYLKKTIPDITTQERKLCPGRFYDNISHVRKLIFELDGPHHFIIITLWKNDVDKNQDIDVYKMKVAIDKGFRIIRILQEDVYKNDEDWLDIHLKPLIEKGRPIEYVSPYNEHIYDNHRAKFAILENKTN